LFLLNTLAEGDTSQKEDNFLCRRCEYPSHNEFPKFPTVRESAEEGISIGICASDSAPTNVKCNKDKSNRCVSIRISESLLSSCSNKLAKYFPDQQKSYEMKGCWNSDFDHELESMTDKCGATFEQFYSCEGSLCNKDPDPPVVHTSIFIAVPVILIVIVLGAVGFARYKEVLCFSNKKSTYDVSQRSISAMSSVENGENQSLASCDDSTPGSTTI